jgi:hypothetical protein
MESFWKSANMLAGITFSKRLREKGKVTQLGSTYSAERRRTAKVSRRYIVKAG